MRRFVIVLAISLAFGGALWSRTTKPDRNASSAPTTAQQPARTLQAMRASARGSLRLQNGGAGSGADPANAPPDSTYEEYMRNRQPGDEPASPPTTQPGSSDAESTSRFSLQVNLDFTNNYFFHGIVQQTEGMIIQPGAELAINLFERDDFSVDALLGFWNSFGENSGTKTGTVISDWYEADYYAGLAISKGKFSLITTYTFFTSPSDAYHTVEELDFTLAYDDTDHLGKFALQPYILLGIETAANGNDGEDGDRGTYLELGIAPGFTFDFEKTPVTITFPISAGFSIHDYYEDDTGDDDTFGFVQAGVNASFPLPFGDRFGEWSLNAGAAVLYLGDHTAEYNDNDDTEFIATLGIQINF